MDVVTELVARATGYLILLQDIIARTPPQKVTPADQPADNQPTAQPATPQPATKDPATPQPATSTQAEPQELAVIRIDPAAGLAPATQLFAESKELRDRAQELAPPGITAEPFPPALKDYLTSLPADEQSRLGPLLPKISVAIQTVSVAIQLVAWVEKRFEENPTSQTQLQHRGDGFVAPEFWRRWLRAQLHRDVALRQSLAECLQYVPSLVAQVLAAAAQAGKPLDEAKTREIYESDQKIAAALTALELPLPFALAQLAELDDINGRRRRFDLPTDETLDPLERADKLHLVGLAFSGGGIRSATFNLGLLQGLTQRGWLSRIDYLSTVSGGGYVGSWLVAWIKRLGSLHKAINRLDPNISSGPRAEEVRPIRWLRMYSNYLAPNPSIMSTDSWTMGLTWLRNTLLNQITLILALAAVLAFGGALVRIWLYQLQWSDPGWRSVLVTSLVLLGPGALLAGYGMSMFDQHHRWPPRKRVRWLVAGMAGLALLGAYLCSGWMFSLAFPHRSLTSSSEDINPICDILTQLAIGYIPCSKPILWPVSVVGTLLLLLIAALGRYDKCFYPSSFRGTAESWTSRWWIAVLAILSASIIAACAGTAALTFVWWVLDVLRQKAADDPGQQEFYQYLGLTLGPPLTLEALGVSVVVRMALLGRNFPDERREWWGRMGAVIQLMAFVWLLLAGSTLLAEHGFRKVNFPYIISVLGGWSALIIAGLRLAFSPSTTAAEDKPDSSAVVTAVVGVAPYAFALVLLMLVAKGIVLLLHHTPLGLPMASPGPALGLAVVFGLLALLLGWRLSVNEFSMHHFYRNRLSRAYLGASRRRLDREQSANAFTSFDQEDDLKLTALCPDAPPPLNEDPYEGPYLLINTALNATKVTDLAQQDRKAESFVFSPRYCGFDISRIRPEKQGSTTFEYGYRPTRQYAYSEDNGPAVGTAMTISGAAANPNWGYHSSPATAFLLTLFNVRLGWWLGNPAHATTWKQADPGLGLLYLLYDTFGRSATDDRFVCLSDGGHFDNMGLYELVRRRTHYVILGDGEEDHDFTCEGLANAIRRCRVDFGVEIEIDVTSITQRDEKTRYSTASCAVGRIHYPDRPDAGWLLYCKSSLTNTLPTDVREYAEKNKVFPHESTGDQFFSEPQFESYRRLGLHIADLTFEGITALQNPPQAQDLEAVFNGLFRKWGGRYRPKTDSPAA